jgi:uncharacterized protein involved in exopolysaccharide biosynthesis
VSDLDFDGEEVASPGLPGFLQDPLGALRRRWKWMLPVLLLGLAGSAAVVSGMTPTYLATATVLVRSQQIPESFVRPTVEEDPLRRVDEMVGQVLTQERLGQLVDEHGLYADRARSEPRSEIVGRVRRNIEIAPAPGFAPGRGEAARIFTVSYEYDEPEAAAKVANEIAGLLPTESVRNRTRKARATTEFLRRELDAAEVALRDQNARITEFKERYRGELPGELQANLGKLERLQAQRQSLALQIAESANRVAALAAQGQAAAAGGSGGATDPGARLEQLRAQLAAERAVHTDRHPTVVALQQEIAALEAALGSGETGSGSTTAALVAAENVTLRELRSQLRATEAELADLDARVGRTPARAEDLSALEEKATVLRESYLEFLRKVQEAELAENLEATQSGERVSVLNWATPPTRPERARWKYLVVGIIASFGAAAAVGVLLETFDPVLLSPAQMEAASDLPVLGSVPRIA